MVPAHWGVEEGNFSYLCGTGLSLELSERGEFEITDVNNEYTRAGEMTFDILPGWWADAGTHASKLKASTLVALAKGVTFQDRKEHDLHGGPSHAASRTDATGPNESRPPLKWVSRSFLLGPNVMALRAKLALGHLAGPTTVQSRGASAPAAAPCFSAIRTAPRGIDAGADRDCRIRRSFGVRGRDP